MRSTRCLVLGKHYVGKADGGKSVRQRWSAYATNGHGGNVELEDAETVTFSVGGRGFEIDLSAENAQSLRDAFAPYVSAERTVKAGVRGSTSRSCSGSSSRDLAAVGAWDNDNHYTVSPRGRVPEQVIEAYDNAN